MGPSIKAKTSCEIVQKDGGPFWHRLVTRSVQKPVKKYKKCLKGDLPICCHIILNILQIQTLHLILPSIFPVQDPLVTTLPKPIIGTGNVCLRSPGTLPLIP